MHIAIVLVTLPLISMPASADIWNGNELYDMCQKGPHTPNGYVVGVFDKSVADNTLAEFWAPSRENKEQLKKVIKPFCIPDKVRVSQMRDVVCKFLTERPSQRHLAGAPLVQTALAEAFPCQ